MRKTLVIIIATALLGLVGNPVWSAGTLKVTTSSGGQQWTTGKKYTIKWDKGNAGAYVKIQLLKSGKAYKTIKAKTKNDGRHRWKIPASTRAGSAYKIKIISKTDSTVSDSSNKVFTITKGTGATGDLEITAPNADESWTKGKRETITWDKGNGKGRVKIELLKSGKPYKVIKARTKNDGRHRWKIPASVKTGSTYKIKITSKKDRRNKDSSARNFTISETSGVSGGGGGGGGGSGVSGGGGGGSGVSGGGGGSSTVSDTSTITVTSPNGGQTWMTGKKYTTKWDKGNAGAYVKIQLLKSGKAYKTIKAKTKNDGRHRWKIPSSVAIGSAYKIKITSTTDSGDTDSSDSNFTINKVGGGGGDDGSPTVSLSCTPGSASESGGEFTCTLSLSSSTTKKVSVSLAYSGTARKGKKGTRDYSSSRGKYFIAAGDTSVSWTLTGTTDDKTEDDETVVINVNKVTNATENGTQRETLTLTDAASTTTKPTVSLSCTPGSASESGGEFTCTLSLSSSTTKKVSVSLAYSGTARKGKKGTRDYSSSRGKYFIAAGDTSVSWTLTGTTDDKTEDDETVVINVNKVTNATENGTQRETLTLTDETTPTVSLSINDVTTTNESNAEFTVSLSAASTETITVDYASSDGTATAGSDYTETSGTLTFSPDDTSKTFTVPILTDNTEESDETVTLTLSNASNADISDATGTLTIKRE